MTKFIYKLISRQSAQCDVWVRLSSFLLPQITVSLTIPIPISTTVITILLCSFTAIAFWFQLRRTNMSVDTSLVFSIRTLLQNKPAGKFQFPRSMEVFIYYVLFILQEFINHRSSRTMVIFYRSNLLHKHLAVTGTLACLFPKPPLCFFP